MKYSSQLKFEKSKIHQIKHTKMIFTIVSRDGKDSC